MTDLTPGTWQRWLYDRSPTVFRGHYGQRLIGTVGLLWDSLSQATLDAWLAPMLERSVGPAYDALTPIGEEQQMPQYPGEDWLTYRNRLRDPWGTWDDAGTPNIIIEQLEAAGLPGAQWFRWTENGSRTEFAIWYGAGTHPVTGSPTVGAFTIGDGTILGPEGLTQDQIRAYKDLINHWKPALWVCTNVIFELSGWTVGAGHVIGEAGLTVGGEQVRMGV